MRRFCIAAILAGTFSTLAFAQSLRPTYAPDGASQSAQSVPPMPALARLDDAYALKRE